MKRLFLAMFAAFVTTASTAEDLFVVCDNGLRCVRAPCPSRDVVQLPSGKRYPRTSPRFEGLSEAEIQRLAQDGGLYDATLVLSGAIDEGPPLRIVARRIVRAAAGQESALCRRRAAR